MQVSLIMDNIVFSLQRMGGASVYWGHLLEAAQADPTIDLTVIERSDGLNNTVRSNLNVTAPVILQDRVPRRVAQFVRASVPAAESLFHSSCYRLSRGKSCHDITTVHDFIWAYYTHGLNRAIHMAQIRDAVLGAEGVICVSESTKRDMLRFIPGASNKRIKVVYQGYDEASYTYAPAERKDQVVYVGSRVAFYKNFWLSAEAVAASSDVTLVIVGAPLTDAEKTRLDALLPHRYVSKVFPSSAEVCQILRESIALLYLSEYEGFGIPVLEGMASGAPVIAKNVSSIPEVAGEAGILLDEPTADGVAREIERLRQDRSYRDDVVQKGLQQVKGFSWDRTTRETLDFYHEMFQSRANR